MWGGSLGAWEGSRKPIQVFAGQTLRGPLASLPSENGGACRSGKTILVLIPALSLCHSAPAWSESFSTCFSELSAGARFRVPALAVP